MINRNLQNLILVIKYGHVFHCFSFGTECSAVGLSLLVLPSMPLSVVAITLYNKSIMS